MEGLREVCGGFLGGFWGVCGEGDLWRFFGGFVRGLWGVCGGFVGGLWGVCGGFVGGLWEGL